MIATAVEPSARETAPPLLEVNGLRITRTVGEQVETVVSTISLAIRRGETVGVVGESGSGKSMTARAIMGLLPPTLVASGDVRYGGRDLLGCSERQYRELRGREIGMVMQDPFTMLNPVRRCGRAIEEGLRPKDGKKLSSAERRAETHRRLAEVGIADPAVAERYPFQLSGGMRQRIGIAAALACEPQMLIADEPSTALDVTTQREILALLKSLQQERGMALMLITHDLRVAFSMCDRVFVLYAGSVIEVAPASQLETEPLHPYSQGLLLSEPPVDRRVNEMISISGSVPKPADVANSCTFAPRCRWAQPICREGTPELREVAPARWSACVRLPEIQTEMDALRQSALQEAPSVAPQQAQTETEQRTPGALVQVSGLRKVFTSGKRSATALDGISLSVAEKASVGIVGESGSGKTTLARILVGLETASDGQVDIGGFDVSDWARVKSADRQKFYGTVQMVFQDPYSSLNPMRSIGSTLGEVVSQNDPKVRNVKAHVGELLRSVGLAPDYSQRKPVALSGGERQRVAIARALAVDPRLLICDEPVSALDVSVQAQILNLLRRLREERGISYLFITHDLSIIRQIAEYIYVMCRGRVVESGPADDVLDRPTDPYTRELLASIPRSEAQWLAEAEAHK